MSKVEVDLNQLAAAVSAAILQFAQPQPTITQKAIDDLVREEQPKLIAETTKKRGRPKKQKLIINEDKEQTPEEEIILDEPQQSKSDFTTPAKKSNFNIEHDPDRKIAKRVPFKKKKRVNQWTDDLTIATNAMYNDKGEKIIYPPHTAPREAQEEQEYECDNCGRKFMAFPSYIPSKIEGNQPLIKCYNCNTR